MNKVWMILNEDQNILYKSYLEKSLNYMENNIKQDQDLFTESN